MTGRVGPHRAGGANGPADGTRQFPLGPHTRERGAASLLALAIGLTLVAAGVAGAAVGAARVARHEARTAADLGALAGAVRVIEGPEAACGRAAELVAANGGRLTSCYVDGLDLVVRAEVTVTPLPGLVRHAIAAARAGPVSSAQ